MKIEDQARCPSCGLISPSSLSRCPDCGAQLPAKADREVDEIITDIDDLIVELDETAAAQSPAEARAAHPEDNRTALEAEPKPEAAAPARPPSRPAEPEQPPARPKKEPPHEKKEAETFQCLVCGSTIPGEADKCGICGTVFVEESQAHSFSGLPVEPVGPRRDEDGEGSAEDPGEGVGQPEGAGGLEIPQAVPPEGAESPQRKRILKKVLKKR